MKTYCNNYLSIFLIIFAAEASARNLKADFTVRLLQGDQPACTKAGVGVTPNECLATDDPHPECTPFRSTDYCAPDESFQTYITMRSKFVAENPEGSHWFHNLENKLAGYKVSAALGLNPPKIYSCSNDISDLADGFTPPGDDAGFVIRATNQHSGKGIFVFPDGFSGIEMTFGLSMSPADVIADLTTLGVTSYIIEEYVPGKGNKTFPMEYKFHMIGGEVASINVVANRGANCGACWAEMDANQTRLDQYGCFTTAGKEEKDGQCTVIDFQTGSKKAHPMKGMDLCSALPVIGECVMNDMIALATKASEAIGVYVRVDMFVGPNNEIYVQEFSTNHMSGFRHCSAIKDENNCIDPCFQGRMWKNTGSSTFGGTETDILPELHRWLNLTSDDACTDIELSTPIVATPESSCSNTPAPIPRAPSPSISPSGATPFECDSVVQQVNDTDSIMDGSTVVETLRLETVTAVTAAHSQYCVSGAIVQESFLPEFNILFVVDISGSTGGNFGGTAPGDQNGDGDDNDIIDAAIGSIIVFLLYIRDGALFTNSNVNIGFVTFSSFATYTGAYPPLDATNNAVNPDILSFLSNLSSGGATNFDDALDQSIPYFQGAKTGRTNLMYFLSDGVPNTRGDDGDTGYTDFDDELDSLDVYGVSRIAIGVGSFSEIHAGSGLAKIDNTPQGPTKVTTTTQLTTALLGNSVQSEIIAFNVTLNGSPIAESINKMHVRSGPLGHTFNLVLDGLNPADSVTDTIVVTATLDFDGYNATTGDQVILTTTNVIA